jgi:hypothetical protein
MEQEKIIERDLDNIPTKVPKLTFDASAYEGKKVQIDKVEEIEAIDRFVKWNPETKTWESTDKPNPESTKKIHQIKVTTKPLKKVNEDGTYSDELYEFKDDVSGEVKHIQLSETFNLKEDNGNWIISKHPKAKLWKFMRKMGVEKLSELKDKYVTLKTEPSNNPNDDREYLRIIL